MRKGVTRKIASARRALTGLLVLAVLGLAGWLLLVGFLVLEGGGTLIRAPKGTFHVAVADSPEERQRGLSGTSHLGKNQGLLFRFEANGRHGFWMKDMKYSLDIVWISAEKRVLHVQTGVEPASFPEVYFAPQPDRYVLELPAGTASAAGIVPGATLKW